MNDATQAVHGWRWAPAWVLAFVALWPAPGYAEGVLALGALAGLLRLVASRFRGGNALLSGPAWALTSVLFFAYWLPEAVSAIDAMDRGRALREALVDLRYLPFLWIVAAAVADDAGRRRTFGGLAIIVGAWTLDALIEAATGASPLFSGIDMVKHAISGHGMCTAEQVAAADRLAASWDPAISSSASSWPACRRSRWTRCAGASAGSAGWWQPWASASWYCWRARGHRG
jgi:hypothetical protein